MSAAGRTPPGVPAVNDAAPTRHMPDVSTSESAAVAESLDWVGMRNIRLPAQWKDRLAPVPSPSSWDIFVNLPMPGMKGIHMSRLYNLLVEAGRTAIAPADIARLCGRAIGSHAECGTDAARLVWRGELIRPTKALATAGLEGWASHAVEIEGLMLPGRFDLWMTVDIVYSSTCPCSASLARQLIQEQFQKEHAAMASVTVEEAARWIGRHASHATPHSQRSIGRVRVSIDPQGEWDLGTLIERAEAALGTPSQGPVKRADEQAFARRNGQNLMFVEDAARLLLSQLRPLYRAGSVDVTHLESLHPHDAYAAVQWSQE